MTHLHEDAGLHDLTKSAGRVVYRLPRNRLAARKARSDPTGLRVGLVSASGRTKDNRRALRLEQLDHDRLQWSCFNVDRPVGQLQSDADRAEMRQKFELLVWLEFVVLLLVPFLQSKVGGVKPMYRSLSG